VEVQPSVLRQNPLPLALPARICHRRRLEPGNITFC
jgi:hypothetical protein